MCIAKIASKITDYRLEMFFVSDNAVPIHFSIIPNFKMVAFFISVVVLAMRVR